MKNILVGTDFSDNAKHALRYAVLLAQKANARITIIHEHENTSQTIISEKEKCLDENRLFLNQLAGEIIPADIEFNCVSHAGNAAEVIPRYAEENFYDLIVMGIKGKNGLSNLIMGSTSSGVVRNAHIPVLLVPENSRLQLPASIVFAYDGKEPLEGDLAENIKDILATLDANLYVLNVVSDLSVKPVDEKQFSTEIYKSLHNIHYTLHFTENGDVLQGIINFIDEKDVDAVMMIYHNKSFLKYLLTGNRSNKIAFYTHKPLFIFPEARFISKI